MFKFPKIEPEIKIMDLPGEKFEVACLDGHSMFILLELGAENEFAFYDYPKEKSSDDRLILSGAHKMRVARRIRVDEFEALEIKSWYAEVGSDYSGNPAFWNQIISESGLKSIVEIEAPGIEKWVYKKGTKTPIPRLLKPGLKVQGKEPHYFTGKEPDLLADWQIEVVGAAQVSVGQKTYRCLKICYISRTPEMVAAEYYVADTGRTVYFRRYNGPGYRNYEELTGKPSLEYEGVIWRHWYDCIPDHALIIGL